MSIRSRYYLILILPLLSTIACTVESATDKFEKLDNCRFLSNESNDGDSFHVQCGGREYIFRLYFVDCPEAEDTVMERVEEQARYFGISKADVIPLGRAAARFTASQLTGPLTIFTRWEDAQGSSQLPRHFAFVSAHGEDMAELLAAHGFVRVYGKMVDRPAGVSKSMASSLSSSEMASRLERSLASAKQQRLGIWARTKGATSIDGPSAAPYNDSPAAAPPTFFSLPVPTTPSAADTPRTRVTCAKRVTAYSPQPPYKTIGYFDTGTELEIVAQLPESMVQVKFTAASGKVSYAACKSWELGAGAAAPARP